MAKLWIESMEFSNVKAIAPDTTRRSLTSAYGWLKDVGGRKSTIDFTLSLLIPTKKIKLPKKHRRTSASVVNLLNLTIELHGVHGQRLSPLDKIDQNSTMEKSDMYGKRRVLQLVSNGRSGLHFEDRGENSEGFTLFRAFLPLKIKETSKKYGNSGFVFRFVVQSELLKAPLAADSEAIFSMTKVRKDPMEGAIVKMMEVQSTVDHNMKSMTKGKAVEVSSFAQRVVNKCRSMLGHSPKSAPAHTAQEWEGGDDELQGACASRFKVRSEPASPLIPIFQPHGGSSALTFDDFMPALDLESSYYGSDMDQGVEADRYLNYATDSSIASTITDFHEARPHGRERRRSHEKKPKHHRSKSSSRKKHSKHSKHQSKHNSSRSSRQRSKRYRSESGDSFIDSIDDVIRENR